MGKHNKRNRKFMSRNQFAYGAYMPQASDGYGNSINYTGDQTGGYGFYNNTTATPRTPGSSNNNGGGSSDGGGGKGGGSSAYGNVASTMGDFGIGSTMNLISHNHNLSHGFDLQKRDFTSATKSGLWGLSGDFDGYKLDTLNPGQESVAGAAHGAMAGGSIMPGWGHAIGAVAGGLSSLFAARWGNRRRDAAVRRANEAAVNDINNQNARINSNMIYGSLSNEFASGGQLNKPSGNILPSTRNVSNQLALNNNNIFAYGGNFTNGVNFISEGGTHEENPLGGVPIGINPENGEPNLVEENEVIWNDYVFSDRLKVETNTKDYILPTFLKGKSFAHAANILAKESQEREVDPISRRGLELNLSKLAMMQESQKEQEESTNEFALGGNMKTRNKNKPFNLSEAGNTLARGGKLRGISTNFGDSVNGIATRNVNLFAEGGSLNSSEVAQLQELADLDPAILTELMGQDDVPEGTWEWIKSNILGIDGGNPIDYRGNRKPNIGHAPGAGFRNPMAFVKGARNILNTAKNMRAARQSTQASNFANQTRQAGRMSDDVASARSAAQEAARQARNNEATAGAWRSMTYGNNVANPYSGSSIPVNPGRFNPYQGMQQGSINPGWWRTLTPGERVGVGVAGAVGTGVAGLTALNSSIDYSDNAGPINTANLGAPSTGVSLLEGISIDPSAAIPATQSAVTPSGNVDISALGRGRNTLGITGGESQGLDANKWRTQPGYVSGNDANLEQFKQAMYERFPHIVFSSEFREGATTKRTGQPSRHARKGGAVDIAPSSDRDGSIQKFLNSSEGQALMYQHGLGWLDETLKGNQADGNAYHIGTDPGLVRRSAEYVRKNLPDVYKNNSPRAAGESTVLASPGMARFTPPATTTTTPEGTAAPTTRVPGSAEVPNALGVNPATSVAPPIPVDTNLPGPNRPSEAEIARNRADADAAERGDRSFANNAMRFAPILANAGLLANALTSRPDRLSLGRVSPQMLTDRMSYNPMDSEYMLNRINQDAAATRAGIVDASGGNRAIAQAGLLAANRSSQDAVGNAMMQGREYNNQQLDRVLNFNRATNQFNIQNDINAQNQNLQLAANEHQYNAQARAARSGMIREGVSNIGTAIGNIGTENYWGEIAPRISQGYDRYGRFNVRKHGGKIFKHKIK